MDANEKLKNKIYTILSRHRNGDKDIFNLEEVMNVAETFYNQGFEEKCPEEYYPIYKKGFDDGYRKGHREGYNDGYENGYYDGGDAS